MWWVLLNRGVSMLVKPRFWSYIWFLNTHFSFLCAVLFDCMSSFKVPKTFLSVKNFPCSHELFFLWVVPVCLSLTRSLCFSQILFVSSFNKHSTSVYLGLCFLWMFVYPVLSVGWHAPSYAADIWFNSRTPTIPAQRDEQPSFCSKMWFLWHLIHWNYKIVFSSSWNPISSISSVSNNTDGSKVVSAVGTAWSHKHFSFWAALEYLMTAKLTSESVVCVL